MDLRLSTLKTYLKLQNKDLNIENMNLRTLIKFHLNRDLDLTHRRFVCLFVQSWESENKQSTDWHLSFQMLTDFVKCQCC